MFYICIVSRIVKNAVFGLFVILTLIAGGGFTISRMICSESGNTSYEVGQIKDCSGNEDQKANLDAPCCNMEASQLDHKTHTANVKPEPPKENLQILAIPFLSPLSSEADDKKGMAKICKFSLGGSGLT